MILNLIHNYFISRDYINNNKKYFNKNNEKKNSKVLVEFNAFHPAHISYSYLSNILAKKNNSQISAFYNYSLISSSLKYPFINKVKWTFGNFFNLKRFGIYRSFGVKEIIRPNISNFDEEKAKKYFKKIYSKLKNKADILDIEIDNILIGDLIYDTYLKKYVEPTIEIKSKIFKDLLYDFLKLYFYWASYLKKNKITSIVGSHSLYSYGLILRIGIVKNIPTYVTSSRFMYYLNKSMPFMHGDFKNFKSKFKKFNKKNKQKAFLLAKKRLDLRFKGIAGSKVDLISNEKSAFQKKKYKRLIIPNKKIKILISPHDFFDAVHIYGKTLFTDFYVWLQFLGKLSVSSNYDWYIKNRPNFDGKFKIYQPYTNKIITDIIKVYPKIKLLQNDYSHHQIIKEKIDFVLTTYGSVGVEYPYFNIPVINASRNNPHINYKFNIHPKDKSEYKLTLKNLKKIKRKKLKFKKKEIYEYYFMRNIFTDKNWLIDDLPKMISYVGGYDGQFTHKFYRYWLENFSEEKHNKTIKIINNFINSGDNSLNIIHSEKFEKLLAN